MEQRKLSVHEVLVQRIEKHIATIQSDAIDTERETFDKRVLAVAELHALHELGAILREIELPGDMRTMIDERFRRIEASAHIDALKVAAPVLHDKLCTFLHELHLELLHPAITEGQETTFVISDDIQPPPLLMGTEPEDGFLFPRKKPVPTPPQGDGAIVSDSTDSPPEAIIIRDKQPPSSFHK